VRALGLLLEARRAVRLETRPPNHGPRQAGEHAASAQEQPWSRVQLAKATQADPSNGPAIIFPAVASKGGSQIETAGRRAGAFGEGRGQPGQPRAPGQRPTRFGPGARAAAPKQQLEGAAHGESFAVGRDTSRR